MTLFEDKAAALSGSNASSFLEEAVVELKIVERASDNTIGRTLKKTRSSGTVRNFVRGWAVEHNQAIALVKRSPKRTAN